ncbi:hypothetical protein [Luteimonas kalidii]|uniref:Uncharacterized protein n=1 Tax=Luteimonas kalidii TaxID=3042025 RepID=A0ABT6JPQ2_9GAMM|nr:hypothetical protein [Luteimonas kalidii]MDH5832669.1 hypothetical protein [Luteimonas kalidii]
MSSIGSTPPGLNTAGFDPAGQVSLDQARQQDLLRADGGLAEVDAAPPALVDPGESLLNRAVWDDTGLRALPRQEAFGARLAGLDHAEAANAAVDGILAAL